MKINMKIIFFYIIKMITFNNKVMLIIIKKNMKAFLKNKIIIIVIFEIMIEYQVNLKQLNKKMLYKTIYNINRIINMIITRFQPLDKIKITTKI